MGHLRLVHSVASAPAPSHDCLPTFRSGRDDLAGALPHIAAAANDVEDLPDSGAPDSGACALHLTPALIDAARIVPRQPDVVRARAIVRARTALAGTTAAGPAPARRGRGRRLGVAAAVCAAFAVGVAGTATALHAPGWGASSTDARPAAAAAPLSNKPAGTHPAPRPPLVSAGPVVANRRTRPARADAGASRSPAAEIACLQRAQVAFASGDFLGALAASAEHARRFPVGLLAEERDALRVRSLAGAGRTDEARRAAVAFAARFPRSALLARRENLLPHGL